jgi:lipoate-protein ligase A
MIVGVFDLERRIGERPSAEELNEKLAEYSVENGLPQQRRLTEEDLDRVREKRAEMFAKWEAVRPGDALEIPFEVAQANLHGSQR